MFSIIGAIVGALLGWGLAVPIALGLGLTLVLLPLTFRQAMTNGPSRNGQTVP